MRAEEEGGLLEKVLHRRGMSPSRVPRDGSRGSRDAEAVSIIVGRERGEPVMVSLPHGPSHPSRPPTPSFASEDKDSVSQPLLHTGTAEAILDGKIQFALNFSWAVNLLLFGTKGYVWWLSASKAVLASLVDSLVDLASQGVVAMTEIQSKRADARFPVGKARLETIGVLGCACLMSVAAYAVVQDSSVSMYNGIVKGVLPQLDTSLVTYCVLGGATLLKLIAYLICTALQSRSDSMLALAEDHLNDVVSNICAIGTAAVASEVPRAWWVDPTGGILISVFILCRWFGIAKSQIDKIVGRGAPRELVDQLMRFASQHHEKLEVDCLRAYHFGSRFMVEAEVVMPADSALQEVHDISLQLQTKLEALDLVERAFVHVDYARRDQPEHRTERLLQGLPVVAEEPLLPSPQQQPRSGSGRRISSEASGEDVAPPLPAQA
ncbi:cation efflux family-domain-containing protein [Dunaliella salina]|uniref:Cation efflux family-domain-containing protein n=1 Tax=Dunaliella salina TaxID=3046 RepID=A0ABQ7GQU1_DUNSA|nr:cation efflux family-domain-containing protein [Dunaliella salina]|eukprot:KAF5836980.1 cation efflux family-domain-containing protein [Dunaliella salina]